MKYTIYLSIFLLLLTLACEESKIKPTIDNSIGAESIPVQESWDAEIYFTEDGKLKVIMYADHLQVFEERKTTLLEGVKIDFYDENEHKTSSITSKKGEVNDVTKDMLAIDSVVAVSDSGVTLTTDELKWREKDRKILTDKFVTIISNEEKIEGYGFESDQHLDNYVIYNITYITTLKKEK